MLQKQAEQVTKQLTKAHHGVLDNFIKFKLRNDKFVTEN